MKTLINTSAIYPTKPQQSIINNHHRGGFVQSRLNQTTTFKFAKAYNFSGASVTFFASTSHKISLSVVAAAKKNHNNKERKNKKKKEDTHSFLPKEDEATGPFPEAVLLKEKKVQEDGRLLPEFADADEEKLYEFLNLEMESKLNFDRMRHYEVVYLIHEKHVEEVGSVNEKVQDFIRERKGRIWRFNDWGMRRLAYKIQKAKNAHYILMNFEIEAKWINDFKGMLDQDDRVIRHLVMKRDEAITEDCPPPPEFHDLRSEMVDDDDLEDDDLEDDDLEYDDDQEWDDEGELEDEVIIVGSDDGDFDDGVDGSELLNNKASAINIGNKKERIVTR